MSECYHCGLPASPDFTAKINDVERQFCCPGCKAVAETIHSSGLDNYYSYRDKLAIKPSVQTNTFTAYDLPEVQQEFVTAQGDHGTAKLSVNGISCAACAWLIENQLQKISGIEAVRVNATSRQTIVKWDTRKLKLSEIFLALSRIGYSPVPAQNRDSQNMRQKEYTQSLLRLGVAGIGMMQVGMVAVAMYAGGEESAGEYWQALLRWVSLIVATPVVLYSARPFFNSAFRSLKYFHLNMDVPVSLALILAYSASCWATFTNTGEVYFDSVSMFTFFLLLGRFLEMRARHSSAFASESLIQLLPLTATRIDGDAHVEIPLTAVAVADTLWVDAGAIIPADGVLVSHTASVDEALLTGESTLQNKFKNDVIVAGTHNGDTAFKMRVTALGSDTQIAAIDELVAQAELEKPKQISLADSIAAKFVAAVLVVAACVFGFWWVYDSSRAFWVMLSILVVTCPCALSLATPAALTAGINRCRKSGMMILSGHVIETLTKVTDVVFDKTGTLTYGELKIADVHVLVDTEHTAIEIVSALEAHSRHPIAMAFKRVAEQGEVRFVHAENIQVYGGQGVSGEINGCCYRFGKLEFCKEIIVGSDIVLEYPGDGMWQLLATRGGPVAWIKLSDELRQSAALAVTALSLRKKNVALLSGDRLQTVEKIAEKLHITTAVANATPESKLNWLKTLQNNGAVTLMVGDGINDVPVLSASDVAVAMSSATQLAQAKADAILLSGDLTGLPKMLDLAHRVNIIIKQNLYWAIGYNLIALPAAALGYVPPWLAAIGMSLSSIVVVLNAMRI